jgi:nitroreductase
MIAGVTQGFDDFAGLARSRRTHLLVDRERDVPVELIRELCELATWAPNHKKTWPWRFALFTGEGRARLGAAFVADMVDREFGDEGKRAKTLTKYCRTPAVVVVGCSAHEKETFHDENRDAVAAGIQNLLLGATAAGLASFWSSPPLMDSARALELGGFAHDDRLIGVVYLGWPAGSVEPPPRPAVELHHVPD